MVGFYEFLQALISTLVFIALSYYSTSWVRNRKDSEVNKQIKAKKVKKKSKKLKKGKSKDNIEDIEPEVQSHGEENTKQEKLKPTKSIGPLHETIPAQIETPLPKVTPSPPKMSTRSPQKQSKKCKDKSGDSAKIVNPVDNTISTKGKDVKAENILKPTKEILKSEQRVNVTPDDHKRDGEESKEKTGALTTSEASAVIESGVVGKKAPMSVPVPEVLRPRKPKPTVESDGDSTDSDLTTEEILAKRGFQVTALGGKQRTKTPVVPLKLTEGQTVLARFKDGEEWFRGIISKVGRDKTYTITYDDGAVETKVPESRVRGTNSDYAEAPATADSDTDEERRLSSSRDEWDFDSTMVAEEDGWEMVTAKANKQRTRTGPRFNADTGEEILTKKQRESRRKREKLKERKELMRTEAQESGLHARWGGNLRKWTSSSAQK